MSFWKWLHNLFVPHAENGYKPNFFSMRSLLVLMLVITGLGLGAILVQKVVIENTEYLAAVIESAILNLTNTDRTSNNLAMLSENPLLDRAAQMKADDMAKNSYFAHTSPSGVTPWHWFKEAGYAFAYAGENLAVRFSDSADVERAWMNSPTHRANILSPHFTEIGVGIAQGIYEGQPTVFVVQEFGAPAATAAFPEFLTTKTIDTTPATTTPASATSTKPVATASTTPSVEGASAEAEAAPKVIVQDDTFIAVKNEVATNSPLAVTPDMNASDTLVQKVMTSPRSAVAAIYLLLAAIIVLALVVMIIVEIRHQHPKNVALGVLLILLMVALLWAGQILVPGGLAVL